MVRELTKVEGMVTNPVYSVTVIMISGEKFTRTFASEDDAHNQRGQVLQYGLCVKVNDHLRRSYPLWQIATVELEGASLKDRPFEWPTVTVIPSG